MPRGSREYSKEGNAHARFSAEALPFRFCRNSASAAPPKPLHERDKMADDGSLAAALRRSCYGRTRRSRSAPLVAWVLYAVFGPAEGRQCPAGWLHAGTLLTTFSLPTLSVLWTTFLPPRTLDSAHRIAACTPRFYSRASATLSTTPCVRTRTTARRLPLSPIAPAAQMPRRPPGRHSRAPLHGAHATRLLHRRAALQ